MGTTLTTRQARMELKTTADTKELLIRAATLCGVDLTSFVLNQAVEKARKVILDHDNIVLTRKGQVALAQVLGEAQPPTTAMKALMALPDLPMVERV
ncbi:MAG: DUF1778 domain-containing protein [Candidatus Saccharimonas sp.]